MYHLDKLGNIIRDSDGMTIAPDRGNTHYQEYLVWLAAGNTPLPYEPPAVNPVEVAKAALAESDKDMARIAGDLIDALKTKGLVIDSDLPQAARDRLAMRKELRAQLR